MPCFGVAYGTGADSCSVIKYDGNVWDQVYNGSGPDTGVAFSRGKMVYQTSDANENASITPPITTITADDWSGTELLTKIYGVTIGNDTGLAAYDDTTVAFDTGGFTIGRMYPTTTQSATTKDLMISAAVNRTYNTGYVHGNCVGAWLANSATADRSYKANTLTENGTVTESSADGASGELLAYSGWSLSNYLNRANDADFDFGTTPFCVMGWFKTASVSSEDFMLSMRGTSGAWWLLEHRSSDGLRWEISDGSTSKQIPTNVTYADSEWHFFVGIIDIGDTTTIHVDGVLSGSLDTSALTTMTPHSTGEFHVGVHYNGTTTSGTPFPGSWSLLRVSAAVPSDAQIRAMYDAEKGMFETGAKVLLQSGTTDAVLDVDVDPNGKVAVTQTDSMTVWDGLTCTTQATLGANTAFEHLKSWNDTLIEVGATDLSISRPAEVIRTRFDELTDLQNEFAGVDLSKAKAMAIFRQSDNTLFASYGVESITATTTGRTTVKFAVPFKADNGYFAVLGSSQSNGNDHPQFNLTNGDEIQVDYYNSAAALINNAGKLHLVVFGEQEGE
jgi:hypothetical protein